MGLDISGIGSVAGFAKSLVDRFLPAKMNDAEKAQAQIQVQEMLEKRETAIVDAKKAVMVAELQQGDKVTKWARPAIVYAGLIFIGLVHVVLPITAWIVLTVTGKPLAGMPDLTLPAQFWTAWGGVCSIWVIGRSVEKRGAANKTIGHVAGLITGVNR